MKNQDNENRKNREKFINILANPHEDNCDWETQKDIAVLLQVSEAAISKWMNDPEIMQEAYRRFFSRFKAKVPEYLAALIKVAIEKGNVNVIKFIFQMAKDFGTGAAGELTMEDIMKLIEKNEKN